MIGAEDQKIVLEKFEGLWARGGTDAVPEGHAQDCLNVRYNSDERLATREGISKVLQVHPSGVRRFFLSESSPANYNQSATTAPGVTDGHGILLMGVSGDIYDGNSSAPLYSNAAVDDFSAINMGNRTYISPFSGNSGVRSGRLQVYDPATGSCRDAAGLAPAQAVGSGILTAANSVTSGDVPAGVHKVAVIFETDTGFWTQPGPKKIISCTPSASTAPGEPTVFVSTGHGMVTGESHTIRGCLGGTSPNWGVCNDTWFITRIDDDHFSIPLDTSNLSGVTQTGSPTMDGPFTAATVTADGTHSIDVGAIPTGPSFVKRRIILATRANEEEFFFVPHKPGSLSELNDNTTTTATINFFDTDLVDSADYLFDVLEVIPAGTGLCKYRGRLILVGAYEPGVTERALVSNINDQETFNNVSGYIQVQTERDGNEVRSCFVLRDTLYLCKFTGTFSTEDNGNNPSTWQISVVDAIIGAYAHGTSTFTESQSAPDTGDIVLLASKVGLILFDGVMRRPELSWKIQNFWQRINFAAFHRVTVAHDPWKHLIYISCPLDTNIEPNCVLVADYTDGRDPQNIRWSVDAYHKNATCIGMAYVDTSLADPAQYTLKFGSIDASSGYLWHLDPATTNDDGNKITSYYWTFDASIDGGVCFWKFLKFRAQGVGNLNLFVFGEDNVATLTPGPLALTLTPGRELQRQINFVNEKMSLKISSGTNLNDRMFVDRIDFWGKMTWPVRPEV